MIRKDFYKTLRIDEDAGDSDIKKSYRALAMEFHPDINPGEDAEAEFKEISEAYAVLGNRERREMYDAARRVDFSGTLGRDVAFGGMPRRSFCMRRGMGMGRRCGGNGMMKANMRRK